MRSINQTETRGGCGDFQLSRILRLASRGAKAKTFAWVLPRTSGAGETPNMATRGQDVPPHLTQMSSVSGYIFDGLAGLKTRSTVALTESFRATHRKSTCQRNIHISSNFHCNTR